MGKKLKYRMRVVPKFTYVDNEPYVQYVIEKKILGLLWIDITYPTSDKKRAEFMLNEFNEINK